LHIQEHIPLAPFTTFKVGGPARYFANVSSVDEAKELVAYAAERNLPLFVLGGGSNLVVADQGWPGLVLKVGIKGIRTSGNIDKADPTRADPTEDQIVSVGAGESWDDFVAYAVGRNLYGVECLSGIPGTVGGTPIQNVGAYGQEVAETVFTVEVLEKSSGMVSAYDNRSCNFSYRSSVFNSTQQGRFVVLGVSYRLAKNGKPKIEYADLKKYFDGVSDSPSLQQVREAVLHIRRNKAMVIRDGDEDSQSAGSFFKNPVVESGEATRIDLLAQRKAPGKSLPRYPAGNGTVKLSAAWLVEQSGFHKGFDRGPVGISSKHSLAIVNRGGATARDIVAFKNEIQARVSAEWGIQLHPEPVFLGF